MAQAVNRALIADRARAVWTRYIYPFLYLDTSGFRDPEPLRMAAARAAMNHPAVAACYTAGGYCSVRDEFEVRFRNSFHPKRSGDVMLSYRPGYVEDFGQGRGISYGSLYNYDVRVPLCFYGPQFRAGVFECAGGIGGPGADAGARDGRGAAFVLASAACWARRSRE